MILTCPNCATRYLLDPAKISAKGRTVRCAKCKETWHQEQPVDMPKRVEITPPPLSPAPIPKGSNLPSVRRPPPRRSPMTGWAVLIFVIAGVTGSLYWWRTPIVEAWPPAARLYAIFDTGMQPVNLVGLELRNIAAKFESENGKQVLVVKGQIASVSDRTVNVPVIRINLLNKKEKTIFHWTFSPVAGVLEAGKVLDFATRVPDPPTDVAGLEATFETSPKHKSAD